MKELHNKSLHLTFFAKLKSAGELIQFGVLQQTTHTTRKVYLMKPIVIPLSMSQIYLIPCQDGYLQVDSGYERDYSIYRRNIEKAGIAINKVKYLFLTHHHDDHAGFLNDLVRDTNLIVIAHKEAKELLKIGKNDKTRGGGYVNRIVKLIADIKMRLDPQWTLTFPPFELRERDILIIGDDNGILRQWGVNGKVLYTPGHCVDHIALVLDGGEVFCGDAAASFPLWAGIKYCTIFMTDMDMAYQSWQKMLDAGARMIYPAHGKPFGADKLRQNIGKIQTKNLIRFF